MIKLLLDRLSGHLLLPTDQIIAALCLLLSFPFAFCLHFAISLNAKSSGQTQAKFHKNVLINLLAIIPTYFFLWVCFYIARDQKDITQSDRICTFLWDLLSIHLPIISVYLSIRFSAILRSRPTLIFCLLLAQLSYHHLSRQLKYYNQYTVNITGPLMVLIIKLSSFAYDVYDKKIDVEKVKFFRFMAWCLLFAGFFTGPVVMYKEFDEFCSNPNSILIDKTESKTKNESKAESDKESEIQKITNFDKVNSKFLSGRKRRATYLLLSAALLLIFGLLIQPHFPTQTLLIISQDHSSNSLWFRLVFLHLALLGWRIKYYVAWLLAEGALVIIGFGCVRKNGKIKWDRYQNINFLKIETSSDFRTIISEWNVSTNTWLNQYIYQRLGRTFFANIITYLVSAFWHGFYPGYYMTFLSGALYTALARYIYKSFTWPFKQKYRIIFLYIPNQLMFDYLATPFILQTFSDSWSFCRAWYFYGHLALISLYLLVKLIKSISIKRKKN